MYRLIYMMEQGPGYVETDPYDGAGSRVGFGAH